MPPEPARVAEARPWFTKAAHDLRAAEILLAADPPLLLFDEPFGALDPITRVELQRQFLGLRKNLGKTSIFVTHDVREAMILATRVGLVQQGRLEVLTTPSEFRRARGEEVRDFLSCLDAKGDI